ncbi:hypothetical protein CQY20_31770 [Mycolicibacterium agri]|uniref:Uncharacterized protein n=1 Tax=Mycolicibacterium agri TaxID=36811 RepID=A0A2A7MN65_MYCAG|nr:DUF6390 family protein [Mycolicibacterium agri]PEG33252.1 hypothetical protein CQY20_31770 [Mycolicibacterium agri]GFG50650.1 hypothetical protein MAGR_20910 [Mycolicibacterium agri]
MTPADVTNRGAEMFAHYAYAPNQLGYCGPAGSTALADGSRREIEKAARQFTGASPYLQVLSQMTGIGDPLDERIVESYWLGGGVGARLDRREFTAQLLAVIGPQAGHYWHHLTSGLADEAAPNHCFHVFGVYPWSRLLGKGMDEHPLSVLENCRITWGTVLSSDGVTAIVWRQALRWDGRALSLSPPSTQRVEAGLVAGDSCADLAAGEVVAVHWGRVCGRLTPQQAAALHDSTQRQLHATNRRFANQTT